MKDPLWETPRELWTPQEKYEYRERRREAWRNRYIYMTVGAALLLVTAIAVLGYSIS